jgi:hypothetical protein
MSDQIALYSAEMLKNNILMEKFGKLSEQLNEILEEQELMSDILGKLELIVDSNLISNV